MNKIDILKKSVSFIASIGVGAVVGNAIKSTTPQDQKMIQKVIVGVGSLVVGGMISDLASTYAEKQVDDVVDSVEGISEAIAEIKQRKE